MKEQIMFFRKIGYGKQVHSRYYSMKELLALQIQLRKDMMNRGKQNPALYTGVSKIASLLKIEHAHTLLETQGPQALADYFARMQTKSKQAGASKALKMALNHKDIRKAIELTAQFKEKKIIHPKLKKLGELLKRQIETSPKSKVLVFNHYRDSIKNIINYLQVYPNIKAKRFIGQATKDKDKGMSQKEQQQIIEEFREGKYNTLCCSSVGEEGLDLPNVDLVIFFEPVPSEIRTIQRMGRTGRFGKGKVIILMAKNTRDEAFYWAARSKERRMHKTLNELKGDKTLAGQTTLLKFAPLDQKILIYADTREQASGVVRKLMRDDAMVKVKQLEFGDFVITDSIVIERKTVSDFLESMLDGRLFNQLIKMSSNYESPLLIVEGNMEDLFSLRNVHRNAIIGMLTSIALNYRVPIIYTKDADETAEYIYVTAKREQLGKEKDIRLRVGRKGLTLEEQQRFIVESLPAVGPTLAKNLLRKLGSVENIFSASEKDLLTVDKVGKKKAKEIRKVIGSDFKED
jgi:Fanconi anemia group M protein